MAARADQIRTAQSLKTGTLTHAQMAAVVGVEQGDLESILCLADLRAGTDGPASMLQDNFNSLAAWTVAGTATVATNKLSVGTDGTSAATDGPTFDLTGSSLTIKVTAPSRLASNNTTATVTLKSGNVKIDVYVRYDGLVSYVLTNTRTSVTYNTGATHAGASPVWVRVREAAGLVYVDYSTDGKTWTNMDSFNYKTWAGGFTPSAMQLVLTGAQGDVSHLAVFEKLNLN